MLVIKKLSLHQKNILISENLNLELGKGETLMIQGKNGSGKTTFINCLLGLHEPTKGSVLMDDHDLHRLNKKDREQFFQKSGIVSQFFHLRAVDTVRHAITHRGSDSIQRERMLKFLQLEHRAQSLVKELSFAEQRRLDLGRSLVHQPHLVLWDEPFAGLDDTWKSLFLQALKELKDLGTTIILSTIRPQDFQELHAEKIIKL